jgi:DnaJ like chaperone protein
MHKLAAGMWGKVFGAMIGASVGLLLAWPLPLALGLGAVGLALGHALADREPEPPRSESPRAADDLEGAPTPPRPPLLARPPFEDGAATTLAAALCPLFAAVARCDGPVLRAEVQASLEYLESGLQSGPGVRGLLRAALARPWLEPGPLARAVRDLLPLQGRVELVRALYAVALADAPLTRSEAEALRAVVQALEVPEGVAREVSEAFLGAGEPHYRTLGLAPQASDEELRAAYRRLAAEHHPDRVQALAPEAATEASERFHAIAQAWQEIKKIRGL